MAWYENAVFYHIHPLNLCGCGHEDTQSAGSHFDVLMQWAEHAKKLGCNAIYIGPVFESDAHGHGMIDYHNVDHRIGTNEDFKQWIARCHSLGLRVIVDGIFTHVGRGFFAFDHLRRHGKKSVYRDWFANVTFSRDNIYGDGFSYENWGGYNRLVKFNLHNPWACDYHFDTVRLWINEFDIDGIRLDAVDEWDYDFVKELKKTADSLKPDFWLMGELIQEDYVRWVNDKMLHAAVNTELNRELYCVHNGGSYESLAKTIQSIEKQSGRAKLYTYLDNHDDSRVHDKLNNAEHQYLLTMLLYTLYGYPSVNCGSEFTLRSYAGNKKVEPAADEPACRQPLQLADYQNAYVYDEITYLHCLLGRVHQQFLQMSEGTYMELLLTEGQFAYARVLGRAAVITAVNKEDRLVRVEIPLPFHAKRAVDLLDAGIHWEKDADVSLDLFRCRRLTIKDNELILDLPADRGMLVWVVG